MQSSLVAKHSKREPAITVVGHPAPSVSHTLPTLTVASHVISAMRRDKPFRFRTFEDGNCGMGEIAFKAIGVVRTRASPDEIRNRVRGIESVVEIYPEFEAALDGLDGFSHIFVLGYFHDLRPEQIGPLRVRPKGLLRYGLKLEELPTVGVFALDSPTRPNPIGLSLVPLIGREGNKIIVSGLDYFDGTPILDIKGYQPSYRVENYGLPEWHTKLLKRAGQEG